MSAMCGKELRKHNVAVMSLWPGLVRTEHMETFAAKAKEGNNRVGGKGLSKGLVFSGELVWGKMGKLLTK